MKINLVKNRINLKKNKRESENWKMQMERELRYEANRLGSFQKKDLYFIQTVIN